MRQATIYIGLNDAETHEQKFETEKYVRLVKNICREYHVAVSVNRMSGSYFHEDGTYVEEETLVLMIMGVPDETIREIARDVCVFFNQESVLVSYAECETHFMKERIQIDG